MDPLEQVEADAWQQQYTGLDPDLRPLAVRLGELRVFGVGGLPDSPWHHVVVGLTGGAERLDPALALLARLGARSPVVQVAAPVNEAVLRDRGFAPTTRLVRVSGPALALRPDAVQVSTAASTVAALCLAGFGPAVDQRWWTAALGRPGWTQVVAYDDGTPVGTAALFVAGESAWLGSATVVPAARRAGVHKSLVAARLHLAGEQGALTVSAKCAPGSPAHRNLLAAGLVPAHPVVQWRRIPSSQ